MVTGSFLQFTYGTQNQPRRVAEIPLSSEAEHDAATQPSTCRSIPSQGHSPAGEAAGPRACVVILTRTARRGH